MMIVEGLRKAVQEYNACTGSAAIYLNEYENQVYTAEPNYPWTHPDAINHDRVLVVKYHNYKPGVTTTEQAVQAKLEDL